MHATSTPLSSPPAALTTTAPASQQTLHLLSALPANWVLRVAQDLRGESIQQAKLARCGSTRGPPAAYQRQEGKSGEGFVVSRVESQS